MSEQVIRVAERVGKDARRASAKTAESGLQQGILRIGRVVIRPGFLVVAVAGMIASDALLVGYFLAAAALHELGHIAALLIFGGRIELLELSALGMRLDCDKRRLSYPQEIVCYLAGPIFSIIFGVLAAFLGKWLDVRQLFVFSGASLLLGAFNLLPAASLDGGGALKALSLLVFDREVAALRLLHFATVAALAALGLWLAANGMANLGLVWIAAWMLLKSE